MLKRYPSDKINRTKNAEKFPSLFFRELQLITVLFCDSNMSWSTRFVRLSKIVCGIFYFRCRFAFVKVYIFVQQNAWKLANYIYTYTIHTYIYTYIHTHTHVYLCNYQKNVRSRLSPQWLCGNSCTWAHDVPWVATRPLWW